MISPDYDVVIVGGGPTGVTLAIAAAQSGARVIVCEREASVHPLPRAAHIDHETLRIFQSMGAADAIAKTCRTTSRYDFLSAKGTVLLRFDGADLIGSGGWPAANMIHQPSLERILRLRLAAQAGAKLRAKWAYLRHEEDRDGVTVWVQTPRGEQTLRAHFLVGADGTHSGVRQSAGIELEDLKFDEQWLVVDALVRDPSRLPDINLQICDPARPATCVLMGEGRHRWEFMLLPGETPEQVRKSVFIQELLKPWNIEGAATIERSATYRFNARIAQEWSKGRVLLAGDAAHQTPPFAGQGMCAGVRDAANLGWKLGAIARGEAEDALLLSYQKEREPHVRAVIDTAIKMGRIVCTTSKWTAFRRDWKLKLASMFGKLPAGPPAYPDIAAGVILEGSPGAGSYFPQAVTYDGLRLDDFLGTGVWLIGFNLRQVPADIIAVDLEGLQITRFANFLRAWLARHGAQAVLVRPDRYVFGCGDPNNLVAAWHSMLRQSPRNLP